MRLNPDATTTAVQKHTGHALRAARLKKGMTQHQLGEKILKLRGSVCHIELGLIAISLTDVFRGARACEMTLRELSSTIEVELNKSNILAPVGVTAFFDTWPGDESEGDLLKALKAID